MLRLRKVMNATCISTSGSEARWVCSFTLFILSPWEDGPVVYGGTFCCPATIDSLLCSF